MDQDQEEFEKEFQKYLDEQKIASAVEFCKLFNLGTPELWDKLLIDIKNTSRYFYFLNREKKS